MVPASMPSKPASPPPSTQLSEPCVDPSSAYESTPPANASPSESDWPYGVAIRVSEARMPVTDRRIFGWVSRHEQLVREHDPARHEEHAEQLAGVSVAGGGSEATGASWARAAEGIRSPTTTTIPTVKRILED